MHVRLLFVEFPDVVSLFLLSDFVELFKCSAGLPVVFFVGLLELVVIRVGFIGWLIAVEGLYVVDEVTGFLVELMLIVVYLFLGLTDQAYTLIMLFLNLPTFTSIHYSIFPIVC